MSHAHYFPTMYPADEECICYGKCNCGLVKYFIDYYGETKKGITLEGLKKRATQLNQISEVEFAKVAQEHAEILAVIPEPPRGNRALMGDYYRENRSWISSEVAKYGFNNTRRRWGLSIGALYKIIKSVT